MVQMPFEKKSALSISDIEKLIDKGAPVKSDLEKKQKNFVVISLRLPQDMLLKIDERVENSIGLNRTGWILQALQKELEQSDLNN